MKIIIPSIQVPFIKGGATFHIENLKKSLQEYGHEVEVVTFPFTFSSSTSIIDLIHFCSKQNFNHFDVDKIISLQFPAYYVQHTNKTLWIMHQYRAVYDLYEKQEKTVELELLKNQIVTFDNNYLNLDKQIFSNSKNVAKRLRKYNNIDSTPLYHPPSDADNFYCDETYNYVFFPSRLEELKRQDLLIKAMQYTKTSIKAIIAGTGGKVKEYQTLINKLDLNHKIKLIGEITQEEKFSFYAHCLAVVFPPFDEDYGYITLEAMLSSKAVITCSDSGGPLEFITNETGFIINPTPEELAIKLDWIYHNKTQVKQVGRNGLELYKSKNITWNNVVQRLIEN